MLCSKTTSSCNPVLTPFASLMTKTLNMLHDLKSVSLLYWNDILLRHVLDFPSSPTKSYQRQVDALSELFVAWDDTLTDAEHKITKLERERAERRRMGLQ